MKFGIVGDPPPEAWNRVQRYASWMHRVCVNERLDSAEDTFQKLRLSSPVGGWFPALQVLSWRITESNLPHIDLFFSPRLRNLFIFTPPLWDHHGALPDILPALASTISALPASALQALFVDVGCDVPSAYFTDSLFRRFAL